MFRTCLAMFAFAAALSVAGAAAGVPAPAPLAPNDYSSPAAWLCRPGAIPNACDTDLTTTVVAADGSVTSEPFRHGRNPPIDCFYVYPTVSIDPSVLSSMKVEVQERTVITQQFARFGARCRLYAPLYRQFTLTALAAGMSGHPMPGSTPRPTTPYDDVRDAWAWYLAHANAGRGVVLIGHSQGSGVLTQLIKTEIDGKLVQKRLVSAILMGTSLTVPRGADVGGDFKTIPFCREPSQLGCVIAYASFRDTVPPPADTLFGRPRAPADPGLAAACVNPANLAGGEGPLHAYLASTGADIAAVTLAPGPWAKGKTVATPFVSVPGLLTARCVSTPELNYLAIHVNADPIGPRTQDITGDLVIGGKVQANWGLHLIDVNLAIGNLIDIVGAEAKAWEAAGGR